MSSNHAALRVYARGLASALALTASLASIGCSQGEVAGVQAPADGGDSSADGAVGGTDAIDAELPPGPDTPVEPENDTGDTVPTPGEDGAIEPDGEGDAPETIDEPDTTPTPAPDALPGTDADVPEEGDDGGPIVPDDTGYPAGELHVKIIAPGGGPTADVIGSKTTVAGVLFGDADTLSWQTSTGQSGAISEGPFWTSGPIDMLPGDNFVTVTAAKGTTVVTDTIVLTYNPAFRFDDFPTARPDVAWVGSQNTVVFTVPVSLYPNFDKSSVQLLEVDDGGGTLSTVGKMVDNGQVSSSGDEIQGDGVFTYKAKLTCDAAGPRYFRATAKVTQGGSSYMALSPWIPVWCVEHLTSAQCQGHQSVVQQAEAQVASGVAIEDVVAALETTPGVVEAGRASEGGYGLWVRFDTGVLGGVLLSPLGVRGAGGFDPPEDPADPGDSQAVVGANIVELGSKKAIVLAPFAAEFGETDDGLAVAQALSTSECPSFALTGGSILQGTAANLKQLRGLPGHGIVSISSHGEALFDTLDPLAKRDLYHWDHQGAQEVLWSGEPVSCTQLLQGNQNCTVTSGNPSGGCPPGTVCEVNSGSGGSSASGVCVDRTQVDLRLGRVVVTNKGYAVTPAFFEAYAGRGYPKSLVNLGACRTLWNGTMASAFFAHGVQAITGFSNYVESAWARDKVVDLFQGAIGKGQIGASHSGGEDPSHPGTFWRLFGAGNLDLSTAEIINASFEEGDTTGWSTDGDARVISQLACHAPVAGKFMGLLSSGLGFTVQTGTMEQDFCIPADKNEIQIFWKFSSEEFHEYCGSGFQDTFQAVLLGQGGQITVVDVKIDDLCDYDDCGLCKDPIACDFECMGTPSCKWDEATQSCGETYPCNCGKFYSGLQKNCINYDQGDAHTTLWFKTTKNVKALAGKGKVTLRLFTSDTGDSIFDTVILVDDIRFK